MSDRDSTWNEAARVCKKWLDAKEEYDNLVQKYYPLKQFPKLPLDKEVLETIETTGEKAHEAHNKYREALFKVRS